jgi:hypothetical protein
VAFAIWQFLWLPFMSVETVTTLSVTVILAYLAFRRMAIGLVALGVLGAWVFVRLLLALVATHSVPTPLLLGSLVPVICAVIWLRGAVVTIRCVS